MKMRQAIAVAQLVSQSEDTHVGYWLQRYADGAVKESTARPAAERKDDAGAKAPEESVAVAR